MANVEEFVQNGKNFIYIDFSDMKSNDDFISFTAMVEPIIAKHPKNSVYTITNVEDIRFDSGSKEIVAKYLENNKPYVKFGAIIGLDGIKKVIIETVLRLSGRRNLHFAFSKDSAIEWLLKQD